MKELVIVLLVAVPISLLSVFNLQLAEFKAPTVAKPTPVSFTAPAAPVPTVSTTGDWLTAATGWLGTPYLWGGCTRRGVDCSCFVQNVLATIGIRAPRTTTTQVAWTRPVPREQMRPLDLVYFNNTCDNCGGNPTHVGIYLGDGMMIQSGGSGVSIQPVFTGFYGARFASAGRMP